LKRQFKVLMVNNNVPLPDNKPGSTWGHYLKTINVKGVPKVSPKVSKCKWRPQVHIKKGRFLHRPRFIKSLFKAEKRLIYFLNFFLKPTSPKSPKPSNNTVAGSGTGAVVAVKVA